MLFKEWLNDICICVIFHIYIYINIINKSSYLHQNVAFPHYIADLQKLKRLEKSKLYNLFFSYMCEHEIFDENIGKSVDISDAIVLNSELLCIHRLHIGMSYIIQITEHSRNVFRVSLRVFFLF